MSLNVHSIENCLIKQVEQLNEVNMLCQVVYRNICTGGRTDVKVAN